MGLLVVLQCTALGELDFCLPKKNWSYISNKSENGETFTLNCTIAHSLTIFIIIVTLVQIFCRTESQKSNVSIKSEKSSESAKASAANQRESDEGLFGGISSETTTSSHKSPNSNVTAKPFNAATKSVEKISSSVSKVTPPIPKVTSPISKVIPPVSKVAPPVGKSSNVGKLQVRFGDSVT